MKNTKNLQLLLKLINELEDENADQNINYSDAQLNQLISQKLDRLQGINEKIYKAIVTASKDILSLEEASEYLSLSKSDLYKKTSQKTLKHYKPGKHIFFKKADLDSFILSNPQ
jgi:excisionase family DNA binding protein